MSALARAEDWDRAREAAGFVKSDARCLLALLEIAKAQAHAGQQGSAVKKISAVLREADRLDEEVKRGLLWFLGQTAALVGEEKAALIWVDQQPTVLIRARGIVGLANGMAEGQHAIKGQR